MAYLQEQPDFDAEEHAEDREREILKREEWTRRAIRDGVTQTEVLADLHDLAKHTPRTKTVAEWTAWRVTVADDKPEPRDLDLAALVRWAVTAQDATQSDLARQLAKSNIVAHVIKVVDATITDEAEEFVAGEAA